MTSTPRANRDGRKGILRDVYEENLRTTREKYRTARKDRRPDDGERRLGAFFTGTAALTVVLLLLVATTLTMEKHADVEESPAASADSSWTDLPMMLTAPAVPLSQSKQPTSIVDRYGLHFRTIVLDAGHGGRDPGATGRRGLQEKAITLDVARRLKSRLEQYPGYRILMTRNGDDDLSLRKRIEFANRNEADLYVSIHVNWLPVDSIAPIETYFYGPDSDARAGRLAQQENRNSGYSLAEFNDLIQDLSLELKIQESRGAAHAIQEGLVDGLREMGREVNDWGAKSGDFMVLLGVEAPSVLAEIGSLSNGAEEAELTTVTYREKLAYLLEQGITHFLESHAHTENGSKENQAGV